MSSVVVSTSAAYGRPFLFDAEAEAGSLPAETKRPARQASSSAEVIASISQSKIGNRQSAIPLTPASRLEVRPAPEMVTSGIVELDALMGGLPRGCLTEICGTASSGRTSVMLAALAAATLRGEYCALIDASDALDPQSVAPSGIDLDRLLWVRCSESSPEKQNSPRRHRSTEKQEKKQTTFDFNPVGRKKAESVFEYRLEHVLRTTDLLLESGGFGLIVLDLADVPPQAARRIPLTTWFRFRRVIEHKPTMLLVIEQQPIAGSCSSLLLRLQHSIQYSVPNTQFSVLSSPSSGLSSNPGSEDAESSFSFSSSSQNQLPSHAQLLTGLEINAELIRSRLERKPARSVSVETKTAWAG
jgi:recombination protein RecA